MKVVFRKQRDDIWTILFNPVDEEMPDDSSLDCDNWERCNILCVLGPLGVAVLLRTTLDHLLSLAVGATIRGEMLFTEIASPA